MTKRMWGVVLLLSWLAWYWGWAHEYISYNVFNRVAYQQLIYQYAKENKIDPELIAAVIYTESRFQPYAQSNRGAIGLMQIMPETAKWVADQQGKIVVNLTDPEENIRLGTWYLRHLSDEYGSTVLTLAAYNAGRGYVEEWKQVYHWKNRDPAIEEIPFAETREFVRSVLYRQAEYRSVFN